VLAGHVQAGGKRCTASACARRRRRLWDESARFFDIFDTDGKLVGQFYLDMLCAQQQARRGVDGRRYHA